MSQTTTPATPTLAPGSDSGVSHSDGITNDTSPVIVGTAPPNSLVTLTDGDSALSLTTRADKKGNYVFVVTGLDTSTHALSVTTTDAAGNVSAPSAPLNIDIETTATARSVAAPGSEQASSETFSVHFDQPVSAISATSFVLATTGTAYGNVESVSGSGQDYTVTVAGLGGDGTVGLALSASTPTDLAGNQVTLTSSSYHPVGDTTSPATTLVSSDQSGDPGTGGDPAISGGGRLVAFISSDGVGLVDGGQATPGVGNVYVKDTLTGAIIQVTNGNDQVYSVQISADGTTIAFTSLATNLIPGATSDGRLNLYVAKLATAANSFGFALVPGSIKLIGPLADTVAAEGDVGFALSADGSTIVWDGDPTTQGNTDTLDAENLNTGKVTPFQNSAYVSSISANGQQVAFTGYVAVPGTGGEPDPYFGGTYPPDVIQDAFVYDLVNKSTITIDATGLLGTVAPTGPGEVESYLTQDPVLSGNGNTLVFQLSRAAGQDSLFSVDLANPSVFTPISPGAGTDGGSDNVSDQSVSAGGGVIAYIQADPVNGYEAVVYSAATHTTTVLGPALDSVLATQGNAIAVDEATDTSGTTLVTYEIALGVSASIAPIDGNDTIDAIDLTQARKDGLAVSGTTNAPAGSALQLSVISAISGLGTATFTGTVGDDGQWTATIPAASLSIPDGAYYLTAQIADANGASPLTTRLFTIDTVAPAAPTVPVLDQGSNSGKDGVDTDVATPTLDGLAEPGAFVMLYDVSGGGQTKLASATADQNGVYTLTSSALADGTYTLAVEAQDAAGNDSPLSATATVKVDTVAPAQPEAPALVPGEQTGQIDNDIDDRTPTLSGTAEAGASVTLYDSGVALGTVKASASGTYTITAPALIDGTHSLTVIATDAAGNASPASDPLALTIDTKPPGAPLLSNVNGQTLSDGDLAPSFDVTGVAAANTTVTLDVDGVPVPADSSATHASSFYDISVPDLTPGTHTLTVTATDEAGNVSQPSAPSTVTISAMAVAPAGTPPGTIAVNGTLLDGPIAGATVFADANGNGVLDTGEASDATSTTGTFALFDPSGELTASGGIDSDTGLTPPGDLTAPAGSGVIDPLTTLLDAYAPAVGETPKAAQPALLASLGLDPTADLTQTDPETAAASGDFSFLIAAAKVMDAAVVYGDLAAAQTGVSSAAGFAAAFTAMAQQAATGTLNLDDGGTTLIALASQTVAIAKPGTVLSSDLAQDASAILSSGASFLDSAAAPGDGSTPLTLVKAVESVDQGQAAPQFAAAAAAAADNVTYSYSNPGGLYDAVEAAEMPVLAPPMLDPLDDTGISAQDNLTSDTTPTFTGTAPPGATVILAVPVAAYPGTYSIVGSGTADAGGSYAVAAALPAGRNNVVALEATPGEATASGTQFYFPTALTTAQFTEVTVGDLPEDTLGAPPSIQQVQYTASSANTATTTSLYITGNGSYDIQEGAVYTVTANGNPVSVGAAQGTSFGILTTPLAAGTYSLVVTETALDGETLQSAPTVVTVTAPGSISLDAQAAGPVVGGSIFPYAPNQADDLIYQPVIHPNATTDASGAASVPAQSYLPAQGSSLIYETNEYGLQLEGGQDALTGLVLPVNLSAPPGASVISPVTSLLNQGDSDATTFAFVPTATDYAYENSRIDTALGLPTTLDLATADPLAMAEAGNTTLFLKDVELLGTIFLLTPFTADGDSADTSDPLYVIDKSLGSNVPFDDFIGSNAPAITTKPIDFTSTAEVLSWLTTYDSTLIDGSYDTKYDASVLPTVAAIIAASNAAIEAHAAAATSLADTISYALAVERVALSGEEQALAGLASSFNFPVSVQQQQAGFATLQADYTGSGLQAAVAAALAQTVQVTDFTPSSASTGTARETFTITFSAPVGGVTAGDFTVSGSAGLVGAAVTAVTPVAGSDGAAYTITVATGVGDGTLTLGFTPNGLTNPDGSPLATGTFAAPQFYSSPLGSYGGSGAPLDLATGDFNGDGHTDVLIANSSVDGLTLFLGQGDGSFVAEPAIYTASGYAGATSVVTGDFNGDGKLDAVTLNSAASYKGDLTVSAMLGNGDGTFAPPVQTDVGPSAVNMVAGDFNGDGKLDLAVLDVGTVQLFFGNGNGTFSAGPTTNVGAPLAGTGADQIVAADLNGDGKPDLVIATSSATTGAPSVAILLGNGQGGFTLAPSPSLGLGVGSRLLIAVGDLNGDGIPDIVAVPEETEGSETAIVLLGNGDGTFKPAISVPLPLPPGGSVSGNTINGNDYNVSVAIGDVTGDGKPDIVVENDLSGVVVVPGNGNGTFGQGYADAADLPYNYISGLTLTDVNGDGRPDLITTEEGGSEAGSSVADGIAVSLGTAQTVLPASASVTVDRAAVAAPALTETSGGGSFTHVGNAYTLDLGTFAQNSTAAAVLALVNAAAAPADSFDGTFSTPTGSGFALTGATLSAAIAAGESQGGITFTADTSTPGSHSETITFAPRDATAETVQTASVAEDDSTPANLPTTPDPDAVADELPALTLTITDTVTPAVAPTGPAVLAPVSAIVLPNVRVGATDTKALTITNSAASGSADLGVTATASGEATVSGSVSGVAPKATDDSSLVVGLTTGVAGAESGMVALAPVSAPDTALATQDVAVSGAVFREATASAAPVNIVVHVGDPGSAALQITNTDAPDGFSEALIASLTGVTAGLSMASAGPSADIVAGATDKSSLAIGFSTAAAGTITGTATLGLASNGGTGAASIDGLGQAALASQTVGVTITVDNYAKAGFAAHGGTLTAGSAPDTWVLNLGTTTQGSAALTDDLSVLNTALGPADLLGGSYTVNGGSAFTNTGFGTFSGVGADGSADAGSVSVSTGKTGTFSETVVLTPTDTEGTNAPTPLTPQTVTIIGTVEVPTGTAAGDVHLTTFDGLYYNFQADGDFTLAQSTGAQSTGAGDSFRVQIHTAPFPAIQATSVITEAAAQVGRNDVTFGMGGTTVAINGIADTALSMADPTQVLDGGTLRMIAANQYELDWSSGESITVTKGTEFMNVSSTLGAQDTPGSVQGLLGGDTGQANDFALPDGTVLKPPLSDATLLGTFADAWTVAPGQSLLGGMVPAASGLGTSPAMTFLSATGPGQILTGSLQAGGQAGAPVTMVGALADFGGDTITNFAAQDLIDITDVGRAVTTLAYAGTATGGVLTISAGSAGASLRLSGGMSGSVFHTVSDQHGGTLIKYA